MDDDFEDDYDDFDDDSDWSDHGYGAEDDSAELVSCPSCGAEIYEESLRCPVCEEYITFSTSPMAGRSLWFALLGLAGIIAVIASLAWFF